VVEMGLLTGVVIRLFRSLVLTHGSNSWLYLGGMFAIAAIFLFAMTTIHLANFPLRRWLWRAPTLSVLVATGEMGASLLLIVAGREPNGTVRAELTDWPGIAVSVLLFRMTAVCGWALLLAGAVTLARRALGATRRKRETPTPPPIPRSRITAHT
ncbi:MAG: hypothetical protein M3282_06740, partial [Gemmatimonadota bacterium]|nr:hypothetical protein [Gemmatimonadota bacterium]